MKKIFLIFVSTVLLVACNNEKKTEGSEKEKTSSSTESQEEKNKQTALASVNAFMAGDVDAVLKDVTADAIDYFDGSMPPAKGIDSIKAGLKAWREAFSEMKGDNIWAIADGDHVAVFGDWTATFKTDFMGMKTAGKTFKLKDADIFKFNSEGKMTEHSSIQSSSSWMSQVGVQMPK